MELAAGKQRGAERGVPEVERDCRTSISNRGSISADHSGSKRYVLTWPLEKIVVPEERSSADALRQWFKSSFCRAQGS